MPQPESVTSNATSARGTGLARRLFSNYVFQTMNMGIRLFEQLLLVPLYLIAWGTELYKDWIVIFAISGFLYWCTLGTDEYFGNIFLRSAAIGDEGSLRRQVRVGLFVATLITFLIMLTLYGVMLATSLSHDLGFSAMDDRMAVRCLVLMTLPLWLWYMSLILRAVYRACGDFSRGEGIFALYGLAQIIGVAIALALREPPEIVALCYGVLSFVYAIATMIDVSRRYPAVRFGFAVPARQEWRQIVPQSLLYFTNPLSLALTQNATLLIFGFLHLSALATVKFNVLRIFTGLTRQIGSQSFAVGSGIEMARQYAQNDHPACGKLYADTGRIVSCLVGVLGGLSIPSSGPFISLWTRGAVANDVPLVLCFLVGIFLSAPGRASLMLLRYTNHAYAIALASCGYSIGGMVLAVPLAWKFGGFGVVLAFAVTETLAIGIYPPVVVGTLFHFSALRHVLSSYLAGAVAFLLSFAVARALFAAAEIDLLGIVLRFGAWAVIVVPPGAVLILPRTQRRRLFSAVRRRMAPFGLLPMG